MSDKIRRFLIIATGLCLVAGVVAGVIFLNKHAEAPFVPHAFAQEEPSAGDEQAMAHPPTQGESPQQIPHAESEPEKTAQQPHNFNLQKALELRTMGNPEAPIKITEFASLSCSHCAHFSNTILPDIEKEYIDTGKASLTFYDYPLNAPALHGAMTARCIPESRYFDFIKLLFEKQEDWAFKPNYMQILGQYASLLGLGKSDFEACVNDKELQDAMVARVKEAQDEWKVNSTPTFVINGSEIISGAQSFKTFQAAFEKILSEKPAE